MPSFDEVVSALKSERRYQNMRWSGHTHEIEAYLVFMRSYMRELEDLRSRNDGEAVKEQSMHLMRKITTLGVACMEEHGAPVRIF